MLPGITIRIDDAAALKALERVASIAAGAPALMTAIAGLMHTEVEDNFAAQGRPRWKALKAASLESKYRKDLYTRKGNLRKGGLNRYGSAVRQNQILQRSGQLASSVTAQSSATQAIVGTNKVYAAIHQFGGKTRPHVIRARRGRALAFGGILRRSVNHPGSKIPARPFLALGPDGARKIESATLNYLRNLIR